GGQQRVVGAPLHDQAERVVIMRRDVVGQRGQNLLVQAHGFLILAVGPRRFGQTPVGGRVLRRLRRRRTDGRDRIGGLFGDAVENRRDHDTHLVAHIKDASGGKNQDGREQPDKQATDRKAAAAAGGAAGADIHGSGSGFWFWCRWGWRRRK